MSDISKKTFAIGRRQCVSATLAGAATRALANGANLAVDGGLDASINAEVYQF
jgi:hypothetical protein